MRRRATERRAKITSFLFLRVPLVQPDAFPDRTMHLFTPFFTKTAFSLWVLSAYVCGCLVATPWHEFQSPLGTILALQNLPIL